MNQVRETVSEAPPAATAPLPLPDCSPMEDPSRGTRRGFLGSSARKLAYVAPVVLLFKPEPACASGTTGTS